jgi:hypothetical protein
MRAVNDKLQAAFCFEGLARLPAARDAGDRAAHLLGAAEAPREDANSPIPRVHVARYEQTVAVGAQVPTSLWSVDGKDEL